MKLSDSQNIVNVESVHYSNDGTVTLKLSDKRELKLAAEVWSGLEQPRDNPLTDSQQEILEREACYTMIQNKMLSFLAVREHSAQELRRKIKQRFFKIATCDVSALVERCLQEMQERDFQSDERFARSFTESKLSNKPCGPFNILQHARMSFSIRKSVGLPGIRIPIAFHCLDFHKPNLTTANASLNIRCNTFHDSFFPGHTDTQMQSANGGHQRAIFSY